MNKYEKIASIAAALADAIGAAPREIIDALVGSEISEEDAGRVVEFLDRPPREGPPTHLRASYKREVLDRANEIDPEGEYHWESLGVGWLIAKGVPPGDAKDYAWRLE